jgi:4a-hydroxytetrahydrobiopterin dehydratase
MAKVLTGPEREAALKRLTGWRLSGKGEAITRTFTFGDFSEAFGFMARAALAAEKMDHHPDWSNSYKKVEVTLSTHSAGGVTGLDVALAEAMDRIAGG